jgi:hypothetical protein
MWRELRAAQKRLERDTIAWRVDRIVTAALLLGVEIEDVTERDIFRCAVLYGVPSKPRPQMRWDRRYGRRSSAPPNDERVLLVQRSAPLAS